ncbi:hypothetical protein AB0B28_06380 [Glycomyces sp. NPDC046736]|uniref:hypothetical protein n=1 Tax=Glycomyces sp. NPDC046736 TaxID=3155615 RepID=UPI0033E93543
MPDWLDEALDGLLEWFRELLATVRIGVRETLTRIEWIHLADLSWDAGVPLADEFLVLAYIGYALVIVVGGFLVMSHETLQTRYTIREIAPRLVVGMLLAGLSAVLVQEAMDATNGVVDGFSSVSIEANSTGVAELEQFPEELTTDWWTDQMFEYEDCTARAAAGELDDGEVCEEPNLLVEILWIIATIICLLVLLFCAIVRNIAFFFVVVCAPIALACHGLPVTEWAARLWWRMLGACMASAIGQAALVWIWVKMTDTRFWGRLFHLHVTDLYLLVIVWMMWKVHQQAFLIARGRPLSVPGSRFLGALVMSRVLYGSGQSRPRTIAVGDSPWGRRMEPPWRRRRGGADAEQDPPDRFPDLPPDPEGFGPWADFRTETDARREQSPASSRPDSPLGDAAPTRAAGGGPVRVHPVRYSDGGHRAAPEGPQTGASPDSPLSDAGPDPTREAVPIAGIPNGMLLRVRDPEAVPAVRVRTDEVVPLAERRTEATGANREREADAMAAADRAQAQALQEQAELRQRAQAAMRRMADAGGEADVHDVPAAREEHAFPPPRPNPRPEGGER